MNTALLALINHALTHLSFATSKLIWTFVALCLVLPIAKFSSEILLLRLTQGIAFDLRIQMSRRMLAAPLRSLEEVGPSRLLATLTDDIPAVTNALVTLPLLCMHVAIVFGCLLYLGWLSWVWLLGVLAFMFVGIGSYRLLSIRALTYFKRGREEWDALFRHFRALTEGMKELKLHALRREAFFRELLEPTAASFRQHNFTGTMIYQLARSWGHILFFILIGLLIFGAPAYQQVSPRSLTGYVLVLLYIMTPLEVILNSLPIFSRASVAMQKVEKLGLTLSAVPDDARTRAAPNARFFLETLELVGVEHAYFSEGEDRNFTLGPIDLTLYPGELVFLAGGNGSGKTTLAKLLIGLYAPANGEIRLDGQTISDEKRDSYRQYFSVVFSDFFLFEKLLGLDTPGLDARADRYLKQLQLDHKVQVKDGTLSTIDLSHGQRKRLALLTAYLEDRPFYVFDEWAADQDPLFKDIFYLQLLPELKARGKTGLVISHDDRYYHLADRLIKLNYGKIEYDKHPSERNNLEFEPVA